MTTGASPGDLARKTEVIDLTDASNSCTLNDYPLDVYDASGGLLGSTPLICGGNQDTKPMSECYIPGKVILCFLYSVNSFFFYF